MEGLVFDILTEIIVLVAVVLAGIGLSWYRDNVKDEKIRKIIADGVLFAQQVYGHLEGEKRFEYAKEEIRYMLSNNGFDVSIDEMDTLIESVLKRLKAEYGDNWYK